MPNRNADPLAAAQVAAFAKLSRLVVFVWTPMLLLAVTIDGPPVAARPWTRTMLLLVPLAGWLLRPSQGRVIRWQALVAAAALGVASVVGLCLNGPRAVNVAGMQIVLTLVLLVEGRRAMWVVLTAFAAVAGLGFVLADLGLITRGLADSERSIVFQVCVAVLSFSALGYCALVSLDTIRVYHAARVVAEERLADLVEAQGEAEVLQRREVQATLATGMAHDLANIVQVMTSATDRLEHQSLDEDSRQVLRDMEVVGDKATRMLRTMLAVGRGVTTPPSVRAEPGVASATPAAPTTDLGGLFTRLEMLLRPLLGRTIALTMQQQVSRPVAIDPDRLEQVLLNLALNARDAMRSGGALTMQAVDADGGVTITIADSGPGIPPALLPRIFEPYFTTKAPGKGTGLGLAMVQRIVTQSGGHIGVTSPPGSGATFTVWLPASAASR